VKGCTLCLLPQAVAALLQAVAAPECAMPAPAASCGACSSPGPRTQVHVEEPSVEDTIVILRGIAERYASFHGVRISDRALVAAAELSARYIQARPGAPAPLTQPATGSGLACNNRLLLRRA